MSVDHALAGPGKAETDGHEDLVRQVLPLLAAGSYVLTDPRGAITSCGVQAEALFGKTSDEARGQQLIATLGGSTDTDQPPLVDPEAPAAATVELKARDRNGKKCPCELSAVPIDLRHGTAFSALIRRLESAGPVVNVDQLFDHHGEALGLLGETLAGDLEAEEGVRLAGVMVIVRPLAEVPWLQEVAHAVRAARTEGAQPATSPAPTESAAEAADRLARTGDLVDRVDRAARSADSAAQAAERALTLATGLADRLEAVESRLAAQDIVVAEGIADFGSRLDAVDGLMARMAALEEQVEAGAEARDALRAEDAKALSEQARAELEDARAQADVARVETQETRRQAEQARAESERARADAAAARDAAEAALAAASQAATQADEAGAQVMDARRELSEAGDRLVGRAGPATTDPAPVRTASGREPIAGVDDVDTPVAHLDLDGRFRHLNEAFAALVGYPEAQFRSASWPSLIDRDNRDAHRELFEELRDGRREDGPIETFYTGGAGLLVPVSGRISLARDDQGQPQHLVLELDPTDGV
jgi:PAS domain S-box-containing protein